MPAAALLRRRRTLGVRLRSALAAAVVVVVSSLLAGGILLVTARGIMLDNVTGAAADRAAQVATTLRTGGDADLRPTARERTVVQVVDATGAVVANSAAVAGQQPMSALRLRPGESAREQRRLAFDDEDPEVFRIVAVGVGTADGARTVLVGASLDSVDDGTAAILVALLLGLPVLAAAVGAATFLFVGRAFAPVEAMSVRAATITARNLHERLPVPGADDEIAALARTMNTMLDRIELASAAQRRFVADASHELRSPLATVLASADLLADSGLPEPAVRSLGRIRGESSRMARLVEDLLLLARADHDGLHYRRQEVDLDDLVLAERERLALQHPRLTVRTSIEPVRVLGDADALLRALRNLIDNAARHAAGTVTITVGGRDRTAEIVVGNDGPPIPPGERDRIFDRFVRLDDSRARSGGGTGLGLPIARGIVAAHDGTLTVDEPAATTALRIRIPAVDVFSGDRA